MPRSPANFSLVTVRNNRRYGTPLELCRGIFPNPRFPLAVQAASSGGSRCGRAAEWTDANPLYIAGVTVRVRKRRFFGFGAGDCHVEGYSRRCKTLSSWHRHFFLFALASLAIRLIEEIFVPAFPLAQFIFFLLEALLLIVGFILFVVNAVMPFWHILRRLFVAAWNFVKSLFG